MLIRRRHLRHGFRSGSARVGGFTLVEILIVVVILGILAAVVFPQFSDATVRARENTLLDDLRYMRTQLQVFAAQHRDVYPGYPNGSWSGTPTAELFKQHLTTATDEKFTPTSPGEPGAFGPYLTRIPSNPISGMDTVTIHLGAWPPMPDGTTGWFYDPRTGQFAANLVGSDTNGVPFIDH